MSILYEETIQPVQPTTRKDGVSSPPLNSCLPGEWSVLGAHKTNFELEVKGEANSFNECQTHLKFALSSILNSPNN